MAEIRIGPTSQPSTSGNSDYAITTRNLPRFPYVVQSQDALLEVGVCVCVRETFAACRTFCYNQLRQGAFKLTSVEARAQAS